MSDRELDYMEVAVKGLLCTVTTAFLMSVRDGIATKLNNEMAIMQMQNTDMPVLMGNVYNKASMALVVVCIVMWVLMFWKEIKYVIKNDN